MKVDQVECYPFSQMGHLLCIWVLCCPKYNCIVIGLMNFKGFIIEIWLFIYDQTGFGIWYFEIQVIFSLVLLISVSILPFNFYTIKILYISYNKEWNRLHIFKFSTFHQKHRSSKIFVKQRDKCPVFYRAVNSTSWSGLTLQTEDFILCPL